jgi:hypothetical protein
MIKVGPNNSRASCFLEKRATGRFPFLSMLIIFRAMRRFEMMVRAFVGHSFNDDDGHVMRASLAK